MPVIAKTGLRSAAFRRAPGRPGPSGSAGFSMIEVLIALVVLALGLLGFALLQTLNLRYTQSANYRTEAANLAYDLLDQMRANRLSAADYTGASFAVGAASGANCTRPVAQVTVADNIDRWQCQVVEALGETASANVTFANSVANVEITWGERITGTPTSSYEVETRL